MMAEQNLAAGEPQSEDQRLEFQGPEGAVFVWEPDPDGKREKDELRIDLFGESGRTYWLYRTEAYKLLRHLEYWLGA